MNSPTNPFCTIDAAHPVKSTIETHDNASSGTLGENVHRNLGLGVRRCLTPTCSQAKNSCDVSPRVLLEALSCVSTVGITRRAACNGTRGEPDG